MRRSMLICLAVIVGAASSASLADPASDELALRSVDEHQRAMIAARDVAGMTKLAHPNLLVNAPTNRILTRDQLLGMMGSGAVAAENFVRTPEVVKITGDVGIVMGHESLVAPPGSASGKMFGTKPLSRRYTNIYVRDRGTWRFLARHANVIPAAEK